MSGPRILQVTGPLLAGGAERVALEIAAGLRARGWACEMATIAERETALDEPLREEAEQRDVIVHRLVLPSIRDGRAVRSLLGFLRDNEYELLHAHNRPRDWQSVALGKLAGVTSLYTRHLPYRDLSRSQRVLYLTAARTAARVVAVSETVASHLRRVEKTPERRLTVIPNGVDTARFRTPSGEERAEARRRWRIDEGGFAWVVAARLAAQKGLGFLIEAFARVPPESGSRLLIAGEGPERAALERQVEASGLGERVRFLGQIRDVASLLWAGDAYACASLAEGHPVALLEAMATGLPVLAPRIPSIEEIAGARAPLFFGPRLERGWAEEHDPADLAHALEFVEREGSPSDARRAAIRVPVVARYSLEAMLDAHEALYREVLG